MTARVTIISDSVLEKLAIPVQAVFEEGGLKFCYKYLEKRFERINVTTGRQNEDLVVIHSGLNAGDRISLQLLALEYPCSSDPRSQAEPRPGITRIVSH